MGVMMGPKTLSGSQAQLAVLPSGMQPGGWKPKWLWWLEGGPDVGSLPGRGALGETSVRKGLPREKRVNPGKRPRCFKGAQGQGETMNNHLPLPPVL